VNSKTCEYLKPAVATIPMRRKLHREASRKVPNDSGGAWPDIVL
jgi:hypothetical protein